MVVRVNASFGILPGNRTYDGHEHETTVMKLTREVEEGRLGLECRTDDEWKAYVAIMISKCREYLTSRSQDTGSRSGVVTWGRGAGWLKALERTDHSLIINYHYHYYCLFFNRLTHLRWAGIHLDRSGTATWRPKK